ncbi:hypothetical protein P872_20285 [Rhodonellum psychrophilum GCM71 = DSM 17998]|uniref:Uncharacterized protein n=1 Tax=Rhodonellum psychrophilum GCM71 = DSM 17998 TaxID=1123057 RepID=U5BTD4_9BACT|nr:hypothetical protein P872_20285 [Rhodonellum psychrophilum GCM71 = DSM 17998]
MNLVLNSYNSLNRNNVANIKIHIHQIIYCGRAGNPVGLCCPNGIGTKMLVRPNKRSKSPIYS